MKNRIILLLIPFLLFAGDLFAQFNSEFQIANRLMQQQRYEDALPILQRVHREQPTVFIYFDQLVECQIQLKQYDEAIAIIESNIARDQNTSLSNVLLGEVYHFMDDTSKAYQIWESNLAAYRNSLQVYINTANTMVERREYEKAIEVYREGREVFNNDQLFITDIPNAYMQAGDYDSAIAEWFKIIEQNPQQTGAIQRMLQRFNDPVLYDITILELEDKLIDMPLYGNGYKEFYELQIWLLLENDLYRRAFATAKEYETKTSSYNFALFNLGQTLSQNSEFELALDAFDYYTGSSFGEVKWRAMEEKSEVYLRWAKYLDDYSLDFNGRRDSLFASSRALLNELTEIAPNYSRIENIYLQKAELSLDHLFDLDAAKQSTRSLKMYPGMNDTPESNYLDGRIALAEERFTDARISLTRSNKAAEGSDLAEKTRYFLALTDFYAGDYEFAGIQLKSLGRQNTSYYANDALELRLWLQEGLAADTTGSLLNEFADAHFDISTGEKDQARQKFLAIANSENPTPFKDDAFILLSKVSDDNSLDYYSNLSVYLESSNMISQKEHLMWQRAKEGEKVLNLMQELENRDDLPQGISELMETGINSEDILNDVIRVYEDIILEFPQGFYAPYARQRLNELPKVNS